MVYCNQSGEWNNWMNRVTVEQLQKEFSYKNLKGEAFSS
jgi:hypothetical protein